MIESLKEEALMKQKEFNRENRELETQIEILMKENDKLTQDIQSASIGFSVVETSESQTNENKKLQNQIDILEREKNEFYENYLKELEKVTELNQKFRQEEFVKKENAQIIEDLNDRLKFYMKDHGTGGNQLDSESLNISNINQSSIL